ncbi:PEP-CTERM sorting domain-containing protein [Pseudoduganella danionis]|uniref:PEP-CTERM sorting domain-containing protein n=2 Tax=Pseudoduganella danionis TaxID=1890295 RepID=A0ABW9SLZ3_9BURK|nr:PEP-CTERM sorting domain-containing protein [Pseudoduganella danionis]
MVLSFATVAQAQIINSSTPIPNSNVLINLNNSGLDWVYAGPIGPNEWGVGNIQPASYRAAEGWRVATAAEWANRPVWTDFIVPGHTVLAQAGFNDHSAYRFASEYWGNFYHVDINDYARGIVTDGVNGNLSFSVPETIYVRNTIMGAVPEPDAFAMLAAGLGMIGYTLRRRRQA